MRTNTSEDCRMHFTCYITSAMTRNPFMSLYLNIVTTLPPTLQITNTITVGLFCTRRTLLNHFRCRKEGLGGERRITESEVETRGGEEGLGESRE